MPEAIAARYTEDRFARGRHRVPGERGRLVFSSSEDPIRATGTKALTRDSSLVSCWSRRLSGVAESLFATLFPSDCRLCGTPLVNISRLPVCEACLSRYPSHCGRSLLSLRRAAGQLPMPARGDAGETRCGLCRRLEPPFAKAVAYGSYDRRAARTHPPAEVRAGASGGHRSGSHAGGGDERAGILLDPAVRCWWCRCRCTRGNCASVASTSPS